ncbi:MAG: hypothetical protein P0Y49_15460 [Candidatus Pedobacter colombiensis]|uniref:Uncharacterized protein n=1 Tax=Candidatus Pedobacter colombiensis TaxID=3121371 RepID=A0AAJ5W458_9SPHI|nr:hypothetical protein [Pedobacter sp.]WEK18188.1 MAG: hypothetical protein P0Y49_15460 [Pedobacter sp.]
MNTLIKAARSKEDFFKVGQAEYICQLLSWSSDQYCKHQYAEYEFFIDRACKGLPKAANALRYSKQFRTFYNYEWEGRNERVFIPFADSITEDLFEIQEDGIAIYEGVAYGDFLLLDEYSATHAAQQLFYNEEFNSKYCQIIDKILHHV